MPIISVEPKTSKVTGGIIVDISGNSFLENGLDLIPTQTEGSASFTGNASIDYETDGIKFSILEENNSKASFRLNQIFPEVFKLQVQLEQLPQTFPSLHKTKVICLDATSQSNQSLKTRFYLEYSQWTGYSAVVERIEYSTIVSREEKFIDPRIIKTLSLVIGGAYHSAYVGLNDILESSEIFIGKTSRILSTDSNTDYIIDIFSQTPTTGVALNSQIKVNKLKTLPIVLFANFPASINSITDTNISIKTLAGELGSGDLVYSPGLSVLKFSSVEYAQTQRVFNVAKQFDCIQSIYAEYSSVSKIDLFKTGKGLKWDNDFFVSSNLRNYNLSLPTLWDPSTYKIPASLFQSGIGFGKNLKLLDIVKQMSEDKEKWYPRIEHGTYYINNVPYYLYSDDSVMDFLGQELINGRSYQPLLFKPKMGVPVSIYSLGPDLTNEVTIQKKRFSQVNKFTGKIVNGIELDTTNEENIDTSKQEFILKINTNNEIKNFKIPVTVINSISNVYNFQLPEIPLKEFGVYFSRKDIFKQETTDLLNPGDYYIAYGTKSVSVKLPKEVVGDYGQVSFTYAYPAVIEFNKNYILNNGLDITYPTMNDLQSLTKLGQSNGRSFQEFVISEYPVVDTTTKTAIDTFNFKLHLYDEFDNSFDSSWVRVKSLKDYGSHDKVYELDSLNGVVRFGDGIHGAIPGKYLHLYSGYKQTFIIEYEPEHSKDYWTPKTKDLNLTKQNLNSGFLYLSRKLLKPAKIIAKFSLEDMGPFETTNLTATVFTSNGEPIPELEVNFEIINGAGSLGESKLITNSSGEVSTIFNPSTDFEDLAIRVDLFEASDDQFEPGNPILSAYSSKAGIPYHGLNIAEVFEGALDETLIFKIIDDNDPFLPYNNKTRKGGKFVLHSSGNIPNKVPVTPEYVSDFSIRFSEQLPQPFSALDPNYDPTLRGFYIVNKKTIQAIAYVGLGDDRLNSNIASIQIEHSALQKGLWTLPVPPLSYNGSQINRATYINLNN